MIERMVKAAWLGVVPASVLEPFVGLDRVHGPGLKKIMPFLEHHVIHWEVRPNLFPCPVSTPGILARSFYPEGGGTWIAKTSNTCRFFRNDEQAPQGLPLRDEGEAWRPGCPWQQGTRGENRKE